MVGPEHMIAAVGRYSQAFTSRDLESLVALFTDDAVQTDPANGPANVGRQAIATFFQNSYDATTSSSWEAQAVHCCGDVAAVDFVVHVEMEGGSARIEGIELFTFADDGRIASVTAYWGDADMSFTPA